MARHSRSWELTRSASAIACSLRRRAKPQLMVSSAKSMRRRSYSTPTRCRELLTNGLESSKLAHGSDHQTAYCFRCCSPGSHRPPLDPRPATARSDESSFRRWAAAFRPESRRRGLHRQLRLRTTRLDLDIDPEQERSPDTVESEQTRREALRSYPPPYRI